MGRLLNRDQLLLITEKTVEWDKSAFGILLKATLSPLAWLKGSLTKGYRKQQLKSLYLSWGIEYVKAIRALDEGLPAPTDAVEDGPSLQEPTDDLGSDLEKLTETDYQKYLTNLDKFIGNAKALEKALEPINGDKWAYGNMSADAYAALKSSFESNRAFLLDVDRDDFPEMFMSQAVSTRFTQEQLNVIDMYHAINKSTDITGVASRLKCANIGAFKTKVRGVRDNLTDIVKIYGQVKNNIAIFQKCDVLLANVDALKDQKAAPDAIQKSIDDWKAANADTIEHIKTAVASETNQDVKNLYTDVLNTIEPKANESVMINEASEKSLPNSVEDLLSPEDLKKFELQPDIKAKTFDKLNMLRLDAIKYEAEYIIDKSKQAVDYSKDNYLKAKERPDGESTAELQKVWDLGVKAVNDYFQKVIDVEKVMSIVNASKAPEAAKKTVEETAASLNELQNMGLTETFDVGSKFDPNMAYAFQVNVTGQNDKNKSSRIMVLTPVAEFVEEVGNERFFWFKLLGFYRWNDKTKKVERYNLFQELTQNKTIVNGFANSGDTMYVCMRNLRPTGSTTYMFTYTPKGAIFYNSTNYKDVNTITDEIKKFRGKTLQESIRKIRNIANVFNIKINQRFLLEDTAAYGIKPEDLTVDNNFNMARVNHEKFIKILLAK